MKWPERPTCHESHPRSDMQPDRHWRAPVGATRIEHRTVPFRTCSFCGGIHPGDLVEVLGRIEPTRRVTIPHGGRELLLPNVGVTDWKYGYPHKVYVSSIPHPYEGRRFKVGSDFDGSPKYADEGPAWAKFYTWHLLDEGYDGEALGVVTRALLDWTGIRFSVLDGRLTFHVEHEPRRPVHAG